MHVAALDVEPRRPPRDHHGHPHPLLAPLPNLRGPMAGRLAHRAPPPPTVPQPRQTPERMDDMTNTPGDMTNTPDAVDMDAWLRNNAHRRRPRLDDVNRPATPTATTNDRRGLLERLLGTAPTEQEGTDAR